MNRTPNHEERAYRAWTILVEAAEREALLRYKEMGEALGIHHRAVGYALDPIHRYCIRERLPPLSILIVNDTGLPGSGFTAWDNDRFEEGCQLVYSYAWSNEANPFEYAAEGVTARGLADDLLSDRAKGEDVYARVKVRGAAQDVFRRALLRLYRSRCAVCGFAFEQALDAAHLKPWRASDPAERLDLTNGLLVCRNHHALLDAGILFLSDDRRIRVKHSGVGMADLGKVDGRVLELPTDVSRRPAARYLTWHRRHVARVDQESHGEAT